MDIIFKLYSDVPVSDITDLHGTLPDGSEVIIRPRMDDRKAVYMDMSDRTYLDEPYTRFILEHADVTVIREDGSERKEHEPAGLVGFTLDDIFVHARQKFASRAESSEAKIDEITAESRGVTQASIPILTKRGTPFVKPAKDIFLFDGQEPKEITRLRPKNDGKDGRNNKGRKPQYNNRKQQSRDSCILGAPKLMRSGY